MFSTDDAKNDADILIVQTVAASDRTKATMFPVCDDIDSLVLVLHHADMSTHKLFIKP